jgi:16S rRNA (guanine1516-N2)-methyltransferase
LSGPSAGFSFTLEQQDGRLQLRALHRRQYGAIAADWGGAELRRRISGGRRQPLARAVGLHKEPALRVLDANAGLGRDGYTLAALGANVTLVERHPSIVALLQDAHRRVLSGEHSQDIARRIDIVAADAHALLQGSGRWDVIYLDPMYPDDGKAALPSKEMQILRDLTGGDEDADALLQPALACAYLRVVVKRPLKAPWLGGIEPSLCLRSTQLRFDVYLKSTTRIAPTAPSSER